jgi:hypothetical protein
VSPLLKAGLKQRPLAIDLFCGLGGWAEGFLSEGYTVVGFDIERHDYGIGGYPGHLVLQDVLSLHGRQFKDAAIIVASPPCQAYSYRAMPWKRAKALPPPDNTLFEACFRIQQEASEAAGRYIPLIVENVRGAEKWVGSAQWHFGSFYLWGDIPALMPMTVGRKNGGGSWFAVAPHNKERGQNPDGRKLPSKEGRRTDVGKGARFTSMDCGLEGIKRPGRTLSAGFNNWPKDEKGAYVMPDGTKIGGDWFSDPNSTCRRHGSRSKARKAASAMIAKIPFPLAQHIARCFV